jgi:hypothetical protein
MVLRVTVKVPLLKIAPPLLLVLLSVIVLRVTAKVPLLKIAPPLSNKKSPPPRSVSRLRVRAPVAATLKRRKRGALASRSMLVVSAPRPVMVRGLVITGRPFASSGSPLSTAVRV